MSLLSSKNNEHQRLAALKSYQILDTAAEKDFDDLTALAATICGVPIALISLVDEARQWHKSHIGVPQSEAPIEHSFCVHAIASTDDITVVEDTHQDERFKNNPFVTGAPYVTFYAGVPLINEEGYGLGTLCVIDPHKRTLSAAQQSALKILARQVMDKLELRRKVIKLEANNKRLQQSEIKINELNNGLIANETRLKILIQQAPVAMIVFRGNALKIEDVNAAMLQLLGKDANILHKPLLEAMPELKGQPAYQLLYNVYTTGKVFNGYETPVLLNRNGRQETGYYNFTYSPLIEDGHITGIIDMAVDVTEQVNARLKLKQAEDLLRFSIEAAGIGTYVFDGKNSILNASPRLKELFGFYTDEEMPYHAAVNQITDEFREKVERNVEAAFIEDKPFFEEYTIIGLHDKRLRWVRSLGKVDKSSINGQPYLAGAIVDITEQVEARKAEQRLNMELSAINEELIASNEEQVATNEKLVNAIEELKRTEENLQLAIHSASLGTWRVDAERRLSLSDRSRELFGLPLHKEASIEDAINVIEPAYRQLILDAVENGFAHHTPADIIYQINNAVTGKQLWIRAFGRSSVDRNNKAEFFSGVIMDITEQVKDDQRKNDFIGMVSHELKTPLTSLTAYIQLVQNIAKKTEDNIALGLLDKARKQVNKMSVMINGFLNVSRLESGKIQINRQPFDMASLIHEAEEESLAVYSTHNIKFAPVEYTLVNADRDKIGQVINNLISNAVKYAPQGTTINVACITVGQCAQVCVKDKGIGITPQDQEKIFDRYYRIENNAVKTIAGFGIGLYLCAEIIQRHEGKIWVESEAGKGATFYFSLPLA